MRLKVKLGLAALTASALLLGGCATYTSYANLTGYRQHVGALVGQSTDELQIQLGPPDSVSNLSGGRMQWTYTKTWKYPGTSEVVTGSTTETRSESYKDANGKTQSREVTYNVPVLSPPGLENAGCKTIFVIGPDKKVEGYEIGKIEEYTQHYALSCTYYENPRKKTD